MDAEFDERRTSRVQLDLGKRLLNDPEEGCPEAFVNFGSNLYPAAFLEVDQVGSERRGQSKLVEPGRV
jgi:hypothetical protein